MTSSVVTTTSSPPDHEAEEIDILTSVLNLEDTYYTAGYNEGLIAGKQQGRLEGRVYGLERGFEKYFTLGNISGRTKIWSSRILQQPSSLPSSTSSSTSSTTTAAKTKTTTTTQHDSTIPFSPSVLPTITNQRYIRHVDVLRNEILRDIPIRNEDEDVDDVDDRLRRGKGKCTVLCKVLGETGIGVEDGGGGGGGVGGGGGGGGRGVEV